MRFVLFFLAALFMAAPAAAQRPLLTGNTSVTLAAGSSRNAFWQAWQRTGADLAGYTLTINLGAGTFTDSFNAGGDLPGNTSANNIIWSCDPGTVIMPNAAPIGMQPASAFIAQDHARFTVKNCKINQVNANADAFAVTINSELSVIGNTIMGTGRGSGICAGDSGGCKDYQVGAGGKLWISGSDIIDASSDHGCREAHIQVDPTGTVTVVPPVTVYPVATPAYCSAFVMLDQSFAALGGLNFTAGFVGAPFMVRSGGQIVTGSTGPLGLPQNLGYLLSGTSVVHVAIDTIAGQTLASVSSGDAATLRTLFINGWPGLALSSPAFVNGFDQVNPGNIADPTGGACGPCNVVLTLPAGATGHFDLWAGGFLWSGGQYLGGSAVMVSPPY